MNRNRNKFAPVFLCAIGALTLAVNSCGDSITQPDDGKPDTIFDTIVDTLSDTIFDTVFDTISDTISDTVFDTIFDTIDGDTNIVLPPDRGLGGDYVGLLIITRAQSGSMLETDTDHVVVTFRLDNIEDPSSGSYSHRFDSLTTDTLDVPDFCDMPRGDWIIRNGKLVLSPGNVGVSTCDETLVPNSVFELLGGAIIEIPFGFVTINSAPLDQDVGDSLMIAQDRLADNMSTSFELVLTSLP